MLKKSINLFIAFLIICSLLLVSNVSKKETNNAIKNELKLKKSQVKNADGSITITITYQVLPEEATDKSVTLSLSWSDSSVNDDVNDYLLIEHDASNFEIAITMIKRASNQAKLTITSNSNPGVSSVILIDFEQEVEEPEELTDLTNTVWKMNDTVTATSKYGVFNITTAGDLGIDSLRIGYSFDDSDFSWVGSNEYWFAISDFPSDYGSPGDTIIITGGEDVTNPDLIAWLQENATQVIPLTDLTNTVWNIPAGWTASAGYGQFNVVFNGKEIFTSSGQEIDIYSDELNIGYAFTSTDGETFGYYATQDCMYFGGANYYNNEFGYVFSFTGGEDVTNPDLIAWLQENGTLQ